MYHRVQNSVLGLQWCVIYNSSLHNINLKHGLDYQVYADDTQLYSAFDPNQEAANICIS